VAVTQIKAMIVEDSRLARNELKRLLSSHASIDIVAEAENATVALNKLTRQDDPIQVELLFLDIDMPGQNGFELLEQLDSVPMVIFTTAFQEFAIKAFEYNTLDYLLKPINPKRLTQAIGKIEKQHVHDIKAAQGYNSSSILTDDRQIFIKDAEDHHLVRIADIRLFESCGNYTQVFFKEYHPLTLKALTKIEARLDQNHFFRANRQQIINLRFIKQVDPWFNGQLQVTLSDNTLIQISRRHASRFKQAFSL